MERLFSDLEQKQFQANEKTYTLSGYASVFGNTDLDGDIIEKGAFSESLSRREPQFLWGHDQGQIPIGKIKCHEDNYGLKFEAVMPKGDSLVRDRIAPQLEIGALKGVSIGFRTKQRSGKSIKQAELFEISLVNIPANPLATVTNFKSLGVRNYAELPVAGRSHKHWNEGEALARVKDHPEFRNAFLFCDPEGEGDVSDCKFLIADVIDGRLTAIPAAIIKASTALMQAQVSEGGQLSSEAVVALQDHLDRYYDRLELAPASKSFSKVEWDVLEDREREARMRTLGMSKSLAKALIEGQRDVGRPRRDAGPELTELRESVKAIKSLVEGLKDHAS